MSMPLLHGVLPNIDDAIDLGVVPFEVAPPTLENRPEYIFPDDNGASARKVMAHVGAEIPPHRRALMAIQYYRTHESVDLSVKLQPYRAEIKGLGTLLFETNRQGWGTDWAVVDGAGEVITP